MLNKIDPAYYDVYMCSVCNNLFSKSKKRKKKVRYVKSMEEILRILVEDKYLINKRGTFFKKNELSFNLEMFQYCGKQVPAIYTWNETWIEEKEEDEK